jgi:hypothetical protein
MIRRTCQTPPINSFNQMPPIELFSSADPERFYAVVHMICVPCKGGLRPVENWWRPKGFAPFTILKRKMDYNLHPCSATLVMVARALHCMDLRKSYADRLARVNRLLHSEYQQIGRHERIRTDKG